MRTNCYGFFFLAVFAIIRCGNAEGSSLRHNAFTLQILHTNDMHSRFEEVSPDSGVCQPSQAAQGTCYGGFARLATLIRHFRNDSLPTIYLDAGDTYEGSTLYTIYKSKIVSTFLNILKPDAMSLGNHEFDDGPQGLLPFLKTANFPIVSCNLRFANRSELPRYIKRSVVMTISGRKIGIIGYLTPDTMVSAQGGNVIFLNEIESLRQEVGALRQQGVGIIIALGHSGYPMDQKIAEEVDGLDLIVGGHTHSFLGKSDSSDAPKGPYPTVVIQKSGRKVYVVQAYAYTKYLGHLQVDFDEQGEVINVRGEPILVDRTIAPAKDVLEELKKWTPALEKLMKPLGKSRVILDGTMGSCRKGECIMGNLIVDAMIDYNSRELYTGSGWTDAPIAFHNSGNIRATINKTKSENIIMNDILTVLPYQNEVVKVEVTGKILWELLEWSVHSLGFGQTYLGGKFMQIAGMQVIYDLSRPSGSKVISVDVRCGQCSIPKFSPLELEKNYTILTIDYLRDGGDNFVMLKNSNSVGLGITTDAVVADYVKKYSPIVSDLDGRIKFVKPTATPSNYASGCPPIVYNI